MENRWPLRLFNRSVLKQRKFDEITSLLGDSDRLHCLDIGSDNGVISYLLRQRGGRWKSADLDEMAVRSIRDLVQSDVFQIDGRRTGFQDDEFDRVVIIDFLEHIETDQEFVEELFRIMRPGGELVINVPYIKNSLLRKFRIAIGQTDEKHGHVRPGYTIETLNRLLKDKFTIVASKTYSKFFSECIDTLITLAFSLLKKDEQASQKGVLVTGHDLLKYQRLFRLYSAIYPIVWFFAKLDLLVWSSGYMLIAKAKVDHKECSAERLCPN
jgi:SAM-dependent methyltransferase